MTQTPRGGEGLRHAEVPQQRRAVGDSPSAPGHDGGAHHDGLTGTWVRQAGGLLLQHELERAVRSDEPLSIALVDVEPGTDAAAARDDALLTVARALLAGLRSYDPVVRWGGGEFLCVLPRVTYEEARRRLQEARQALLAEPPGTSIRVGVVQRQERESAEALVARAQRALREAVQSAAGPALPS